MMWILCLSTAFASGGESGGTSMMPLLWGLLLVGFVYLTAHFLVERLQRRYLFSSGAEYIALGIGLSYLAVFNDSTTYLPAITFAIGWIGLMFGMSLSMKKLLRNGAAMRLALTEFIFVGLGVGALSASFLYAFVEPELPKSLFCGGILGATALATSSSAIDVVRQRFPKLKAHLLSSLEEGTQLNNLLAILLFGLLICTYRRETLVPNFYTEAPLEGGAIIAMGTMLFGLVLAGLYSIFLIGNDSDNSRFLAMTGIICFASGAAFYVNIPVLLLMVSLGYGLAQTRHKVTITSMMDGAKKPILLILLIFAGVQLSYVPFGMTFLMFLGFLVFRFLLKALSSWLSSYGSSIRSDVFRGNLAQGDISLAIALSFYFIEGPAADMAYAVAIFSVAFHELFSPRWLRGLLIDIGEIREDISILREG
jgi:hypothetical protein